MFWVFSKVRFFGVKILYMVGTILGRAGNTEIRLIIFIKESVINEVTLYSKEILPPMQYVVLQLYKYSKSASSSCNTILLRCLLWQILFNLAKLYGSLLYYPKKKINAPPLQCLYQQKAFESSEHDWPFSYESIVHYNTYSTCFYYTATTTVNPFLFLINTGPE